MQRMLLQGPCTGLHLSRPARAPVRSVSAASRSCATPALPQAAAKAVLLSRRPPQPRVAEPPRQAVREVVCRSSAASAPASEPAEPSGVRAAVWHAGLILLELILLTCVSAAQSKFERSRLITFVTLFLGYAAYYLTRNSLSYTAPEMIKDPALNFDMTKVGGLVSIMPVAYACSKFISGVIGARTSPVLLLAGGLASTAVVNVAFGLGSAYWWFCGLWALNGILQGLGAPACARLLTSWYPDKLRGTFWGIWTASNNVGGFAAPIIAGTAARAYGWRYGMFAPSAIAAVVAVIVVIFQKASPESLGYASVNAPKQSSGPPKPKRGMMQALKEDVLTNKYIWLFAIAYFFVYVVRQGVTSWFVFYLKHQGVANPGPQVSGLELGGLAGSLSSGFLADYLTRKNTGANPKGNVGIRVQVTITYTILTGIFLALFWAGPSSPTLQWLAVAAVGFGLYGPQMLIGLAGAETVSPESVSACQGFLGWVSYFGAANAGVPLAAIVQNYGWDAYFTALIASCVATVLLILPMARLKSYSQTVAKSD